MLCTHLETEMNEIQDAEELALGGQSAVEVDIHNDKFQNRTWHPMSHRRHGQLCCPWKPHRGSSPGARFRG